jgi:predicted methyltransferase MtxX (methanogen marker protein 4)
MYTILSAYIKKLLLTDSNIAYAYEYEKSDLEGYPSAIIVPSGFDVEEVDTANNFRNFKFDVRIYQEIDQSGRGPSDGERVMRELMDSVLLKFDQDITLGGNCLENKPVPGRWGWIDRENNIRVAEISVECLVAINRG